MVELKIERIDAVTERVSLFTLVSTTGGALVGYHAGAHIDFDLGEVGTRSYSLIDFEPESDNPTAYRVAVQREPDGDGGSTAMHNLAVGDKITASQPRNEFRLHEGMAPSLLIAGGIGVTPIISFATELSRRSCPFTFHYATRNEAFCPFRGRLLSLFSDTLTLWFDDINGIDLDKLIQDATADTHIYCCGPKDMIETVRERAVAAGFAKCQIHFEFFDSPAAREGDKPFEVEISDGRVFTVPADKSIIDVLEENDVDVLFDCSRGDCGVCQTDVISGTPDHRDVVLSDAERASGEVMQICVSRAKSPRLVLDI